MSRSLASIEEGIVKMLSTMIVEADKKRLPLYFYDESFRKFNLQVKQLQAREKELVDEGY